MKTEELIAAAKDWARANRYEDSHEAKEQSMVTLGLLVSFIMDVMPKENAPPPEDAVEWIKPSQAKPGWYWRKRSDGSHKHVCAVLDVGGGRVAVQEVRSSELFDLLYIEDLGDELLRVEEPQ
jgi:hypothetical protein